MYVIVRSYSVCNGYSLSHCVFIFALFYKRVLVMAIVKVDRGETENCLYKVDNAVQPVFQSRINYQKKDYTHTF